jgi:hypothetical protein
MTQDQKNIKSETSLLSFNINFFSYFVLSISLPLHQNVVHFKFFFFVFFLLSL